MTRCRRPSSRIFDGSGTSRSPTNRLRIHLSDIDEEQRRLLDLLAKGLSVTAASRRLFLSRRTADRRLARARAMLGVRSNAEAIVVASSAAERTV